MKRVRMPRVRAPPRCKSVRMVVMVVELMEVAIKVKIHKMICRVLVRCLSCCDRHLPSSYVIYKMGISS